MTSYLNMGFNYNSLHKSFDFSYKNTTSEEDWTIFHMHEGMEFLYIHEGFGQVIIGHKIIEISPRSLIYFQPFQLHGTQFRMKNSGVYTRTILSLEPSEINGYLKPFPELKSFFHTLWRSTLPAQIIPQLPENNVIENLFAHYHPLLSSGASKENNELFVLFILSFLQYTKTQWPGGSRDDELEPPNDSPYIEKIMSWIEENYNREFRLFELSNELHLSTHYISHLFQSSTGTTITEYLTARRMRQACWLLRNSQFSVQMICQQVGLNNVSYFCKRFREFTGRTPLKYRIEGAAAKT